MNTGWCKSTKEGKAEVMEFNIYIQTARVSIVGWLVEGKVEK